ncbi:MAG: DUF2059 domain-containing protein [Helicobacteraceae bacterium]|jgi:hypothetical protein|nr:DUF2059 domain-containing protein [Helicobacteraceae bacterium]
MSLIRLAVCVLAICGATAFAAADSAAVKEAENLLKLTNLEQVFNDAIEQSLDLQVQQNPALVPYKNTMRNFFSKYMSYKSLKPDLIKIYTNNFTAAELKEMNVFYSTAVGKKMARVAPKLMAESMTLGSKKVQEHLPELQQMIMEEAAKQQR